MPAVEAVQLSSRLVSRRLAAAIAWRYLTGGTGGLSVVSAAAVIGLALSVAVLVIVLSVVNGFERELRERILGVSAHATIYFQRPQTVALKTLETLREVEGIRGVSPVVEEAVLVNHGRKVMGALVTGIDTASYGAVSDLFQYLSVNDAHLAPGDFEVWLGSRLARQLGVSVGDSVALVVPQPTVSPAGLLPRQRSFRVTALVDTHSELDARGVFVNIQDASRLFRMGNRVSGYQLRLEDLFDSDPAYLAAVEAFPPDTVLVRPWQRVQGNLYQAIVTQKLTMFVLLSFLVGVAAFNLVSGLMMVVDQKRGDIAILRSMGSGTANVLWIFLILGLCLGGVGLLGGLLAGALLTRTLPDLVSALASGSGRDLMSQYFIGYLPVDIRADDILTIAVVTLILLVAASLYPAWRATRLRPVAVLAHE
ncbi:MAG: ABC transporter permease [Pseudomonadales bacterium]